MTYAQATINLLSHLSANGWEVKGNLKVPHATSPNKTLRLWFRPQAVYFTKAGSLNRHEYKNARTISYTLDVRTMTPAEFVNHIASLESWGQLPEYDADL